MAKRFRFRPIGWTAALGTLGALCGVMVAAAPSSAAGEKPIEAHFEAECVLAPGTLNLKGNIQVTQKGTVPESAAPGEEVTSKGNTLSIVTPAQWGESFAALGAKTARGKVTSTILDVSSGQPSTLQIAKPPEFPSGLPFETKIEKGPVEFTVPSGPEAGGKSSFPVGPVKVTGAAGETLKLTVDTKPGFKEKAPGSYESTGEGIQSETTGYNEAGTPAVGPVAVSCTAPAGITVAAIPISGGTSSSTTSSTTTSSGSGSPTTTTSSSSSPTTTTRSSSSSPTTTTASTSKSTTTSTASTTKSTTSTTKTTTSVAGAPEVTRVLPTSGPTFGFMPVLIEGKNLSPAGETCFFSTCSGMSVHFDEAEAFVILATPERDVVFSPPHSPGTVDVTVTVNGQTSAKTPADHFTYRGSGGFTPFATDAASAEGDPRSSHGHHHHHH